MLRHKALSECGDCKSVSVIVTLMFEWWQHWVYNLHTETFVHSYGRMLSEILEKVLCFRVREILKAGTEMLVLRGEIWFESELVSYCKIYGFELEKKLEEK